MNATVNSTKSWVQWVASCLFGSLHDRIQLVLSLMGLRADARENSQFDILIFFARNLSQHGSLHVTPETKEAFSTQCQDTR